MSQPYEYTDHMTGVNMRIEESRPFAGCRWVGVLSGGNRHGAHITPDELPRAAQALAGDAWQVVPADKAHLPNRHGELFEIDPADVRVGDVVEVAVTGTVETKHGDGFTMLDREGTRHSIPLAATVHVVQPAPDPEQVEAIRDTYRHVLRLTLAPEEAEALYRLGVRANEAGTP